MSSWTVTRIWHVEADSAIDALQKTKGVQTSSAVQAFTRCGMAVIVDGKKWMPCILQPDHEGLHRGRGS